MTVEELRVWWADGSTYEQRRDLTARTYDLIRINEDMPMLLPSQAAWLPQSEMSDALMGDFLSNTDFEF